MSAATLLDRLNRVHQSSTDRWRAACPAHESKRDTRSLSIRESADGRVLLHCFAGCDVSDVVAAVGLHLSDLFPPGHRAPDGEPRHAKAPNHWHAIGDALQTLSTEAFVVLVAAENVAAGVVLGDKDRTRLALAAGRLRDAVRVCL